MENKTGKYLKYAIGEIILVVIGILIALSINNWNEQRKKDNELSQINERVIIDMNNDIRGLSRSLLLWNAKKPIFEKVMNDSMSADLFDKGLTRLLNQEFSNVLNKTGVQQLKALNVKDNLSLTIIDIYDEMESRLVTPYEEMIDNHYQLLLNIFRDKYPWFTEYVSKTIMTDNSSKELQDYFLTSLEYKNHVSSGYQTIFTNYVRFLLTIIPVLEDLRAQLIVKSNANYLAISKEELEAYEGVYEVKKMELDGVEIENKDIVEITARNNFLRAILKSNPDQFTDYFYKNDNTFYSTSNGQKATAVAQLDNQSNVIGFKVTIESGQDKTVVYITKQNVKRKE